MLELLFSLLQVKLRAERGENGIMFFLSFPWSASDPFPDDPGVIWPSLSASNDDLHIVNGE